MGSLVIPPLMRPFYFLLIAAVLSPAAFGQGTDLPSVRALKTAEPPTLDGLVTEDFWSTIPPAGDFTQRNPDETQPSSERTEVRFAFDEYNLYIGIICYDSQPDQIVLTQNRRDGELTNTDSVQILLDTGRCSTAWSNDKFASLRELALELREPEIAALLPVDA